jgi:hypothetical protein
MKSVKRTEKFATPCFGGGTTALCANEKPPGEIPPGGALFLSGFRARFIR